ncbi:hypothetical protein [Salinibacter sp. 10B]|uniref:hypothetical protein n=1 Tax=Salinibacter sp. 10B TaxID=1923971 RepID=UPI0015E39CF8|nr:hypothetical protein [Salinibacter sp. 10B]
MDKCARATIDRSDIADPEGHHLAYQKEWCNNAPEPSAIVGRFWRRLTARRS